MSLFTLAKMGGGAAKALSVIWNVSHRSASHLQRHCRRTQSGFLLDFTSILSRFTSFSRTWRAAEVNQFYNISSLQSGSIQLSSPIIRQYVHTQS